MATVVNFKGKQIIEPGAYAETKSNVSRKLINVDYGTVLLINDNLSESEFDGEFQKLYEFDSYEEFSKKVKAGSLNKIGKILFHPKDREKGVSKIKLLNLTGLNDKPYFNDFIFGSGNDIKLEMRFKDYSSWKLGNFDGDKKRKTQEIEIQSIGSGDTIQLSFTGGNGDGTHDFNFTYTSDTTNPMIAAQRMKKALNDFFRTNLGGDFNKHWSLDVNITSFIIKTPENFNNSTTSVSVTASGATLSQTGSINLDVDETNANASKNLSRGIGFKVKQDGNQFWIEFYESNYKGTFQSYDLVEFDVEMNLKSSKSQLIFKSEKFDTLPELENFVKNSKFYKEFLDEFKFFGDDVTQTPSSLTIPISLLDKFLFLKGSLSKSETTNISYLNSFLNDLQDEFFNFTFITSSLINEPHNNVVILDYKNWLTSDYKYDAIFMDTASIEDFTIEDLINNGEFDSMIDDVKTIFGFNLPVVEGQSLPPVYFTSAVIGRLAGLEPQNSLTHKELYFDDFIEVWNLKQREKLLQNGALHMKKLSNGKFVINQAINSLKDNLQLITPNGESFEISVMRIAYQLNNELIINSEENEIFIGENRGKLSPAEMKSWVEGYLLSKTVEDDKDNLIIRFADVTVELIDDYYKVTYGFVPNSSINKIFYTGVMLSGDVKI